MQGPLNFVNPPRRDVVGVSGNYYLAIFVAGKRPYLMDTYFLLGSTVIIRFQADNPGPW